MIDSFRLLKILSSTNIQIHKIDNVKASKYFSCIIDNDDHQIIGFVFFINRRTKPNMHKNSIKNQ